ncbi:MAG: hypothetical protein LUD12_03690 [Lachnospiraceae bacterium]|nr:hypothetical protein [Lachnospiraceae bacterium]
MADKKKDTLNQAQPPPGDSWMDEARAVNTEHQKMLDWLKTVKFRKTLVGGVREEDVWRKLEELNRLYEGALVAERAAAEARFHDYADSAESELKKYKQAVKTIKAHYDELAVKNQKMEEQLKKLQAAREHEPERNQTGECIEDCKGV